MVSGVINLSPLIYADRVQESFTTTGTGTITLGGAVVGYQAFGTALTTGQQCNYAATDGTNWEVGIGTYTTSGNTLARTVIIASSNSNAAVNWAAGTKNIWLDQPASVINAGPQAGFRNVVINGAFNIAQRGTTYTLATAAAYGSVDRWAFQGPNTVGIANQDTSITAGLGFKNNLKMGRNNASAVTTQALACQPITSNNSIPLAGQQVTISYYAKAGANYSSSANSLLCQLNTGTGSDQLAQNCINGTWSGQAQAVNATDTLTTSWQRFQHTVTLGSSITQLGVIFAYTPTGTAGADDNVYITGVQLEPGPVATIFENRPFEVERMLCQAYYEKSFDYATAPAQNVGISTGETRQIAGKAGAANEYLFSSFRVTKRVDPTMTYYNPANTNGQARDITASVDCTVPSTDMAAQSGFEISMTGNASTAVGNILGIHWVASAEL